ncbi:MAG: ribosome biogenesis GTP-binding protein YihA/YsxC [Cytophagaceae bacterium]
MIIKEASFIASCVDYQSCPQTDKPEFAFIGRSNVGKSSLINMLTGRNKLAKTSSMPGKTQVINHFFIDKSWYLVDLPGYGWARISKEKRADWEKMIRNYLLKRQNLYCVFILIDSRIPPQKIDLEFISWVGENQIPFSLIFTKTDKQSGTKTLNILKDFEKELKKDWEELPVIFKSSAETGMGREQILSFIVNTIQNSDS